MNGNKVGFDTYDDPGLRQAMTGLMLECRKRMDKDATDFRRIVAFARDLFRCMPAEVMDELETSLANVKEK